MNAAGFITRPRAKVWGASSARGKQRLGQIARSLALSRATGNGSYLDA